MKARIVPMNERRYEMVPADKVVVLNSRNRDKQQFAENIRSIGELGLLKPIVVNCRDTARTGTYELVCGEGRLLAHQRLRKAEIAAEVVDCDRKTALLFSLVENIARVPPGTMWFAREMKRMHDAGLPYTKIASIVGKDKSYVADYVHLVEQGEERLIDGVEHGLFSMSFAVRVAQSDDSTIQNVLMDAFDGGLVNCETVTRVRSLLELRMSRGKSPHRRSRSESVACTVQDLAHEITKVTNEKEGFVREARRKENRLIALLMGAAELLSDAGLLALLAPHGLAVPPELTGEYAVDLHRRPRQAPNQPQRETST